MQYVNDDMDELFRRAAKDYPLNTASANWDKVKQALQDSPASDDQKPSNGNNRRHFLWLLLLLPLPWICNENGREDGKGDTAHNMINKVPAASEGKKSIDTPAHPEASARSEAPSTSTSLGEINNSQVLDLSTNSVPYPVITRNSEAKRGRLTFEADKSLRSAVVNKPDPASVNKDEERSIEITKATKPHITQNSSMVDMPESIALAPAVSAVKTKSESVEEKDDKVDATTAVSSIPKQQGPRDQKRFYIGISGGVDVTSVKMQEVKNVGHEVGLIAGYVFTSRWSVEAGLLSPEKAYYSEGEYLPKAYLLPNTKLKEANGDCRMWEVPVVVRYSFKEGKRGGWFAAAGTSSYFMNKEDYNYTYYYPATGQEVERYRSYKLKSDHLFAAAQVSGGYNRRVGKTIGVRVEPYLKLPIKRVGYYDLRLTSFGVHLGVTKKLF